MNDATDINTLPLNTLTKNSIDNNINTHKNEIIENKLDNIIQNRNNELKEIKHQEKTQQNNIDQNLINQLINGIQQASITGLTELPSRDIPKNTNLYTQDIQTQPNYIQNQNKANYIENENENENENDINNNINHTNYNKNKTIDIIYDELQIPILLGLLFFIFQLPIFRNYLIHTLPFIVHNDGNFTLKGLTITSILFSISFYTINKILYYIITL